MSDNVDETRPAEQGNGNTTQRPANDIDWSQLYGMFMKIEQRLPNFDHMLMAMNDYAFQRTSRQRQTNELSEFCGVLKKGVFDWYTSSRNNEINRVPDFIDLTNEVFDDDILMEFDKKLVSSTSPNADTDKFIQTSNSTDASESTNTNANADAIKITDTSANTDASESTLKNVNTSSHTSASTSCTNKRARMSMSTYSVMMATNTKHSSKHLRTTKALETAKELKTLSQSTEQSTLKSTKQLTKQSTKHFTKQSTYQFTKQSTKRNDYSFKIIMPLMTRENTLIRQRIVVDRNIHLGMNYERHWWRQTNNKMVLNVDISDLIWESVPNIKLVVSIIGFNIRIKRSNKWIVLISNRFIKPISKCEWVVDKHMHVQLTMDKREREFWSKCLVTEAREHNTALFQHHTCNYICTAPIIVDDEKLPLSPSKTKYLDTLTTFLKQDYGFEDDDFLEGIVDSTETNSPTTEEKPQDSGDSATTLKLPVDPSTVESLNSDSENSQNTKQTSMDSEVPPNLTVTCNAEVSQNQSDTSADF